MRWFDVPTPAAIVDRSVLERNIADMAARARAARRELWPHAKTHKSVAIAKAQLAAGAAGITVATPSEAEVMAGAGIQRILLTQQPVGRACVDRITALAQRVNLRVACDDVDAALALDAACATSATPLELLWEIDCGLGRCGTAPGEATAALLERMTGQVQRIRVAGLMTFGGHAYAARDPQGVARAADDEAHALRVTASALTRRGLDVAVRSAGSTPTAQHMQSQDGVTEVRPGNYVFHDVTQLALAVCAPEQCAFSVVGQVISRPAPDRLILDSGSKALAAERMSDLVGGFGQVLGHPELKVERLFEEHAILSAPSALAMPIGTRLRVVPNHACTAANLHDRYTVIDGDAIVDQWPLDARGWDPLE